MKKLIVLSVFLLLFAEYSSLMAKDKPEGNPSELRLLTEEYPPVTFMQDGEVTGLVTDVVREILKRLDISDTIRLIAWNDAYQQALLNPNVVLFSVTRTPEREKLFHWIGPICRERSALYAKKGSLVKIKTLDDAKKVKQIGTVQGWFSEDFLKAQGFTNLESVQGPVENAKKLMEGTLDLCDFHDITASEIMKQAGYSIDDIEQVFVIKEWEIYIAISKRTSKKTIKTWQKTFQEIKKDKTLTTIRRKWLFSKTDF